MKANLPDWIGRSPARWCVAGFAVLAVAAGPLSAQETPATNAVPAAARGAAPVVAAAVLAVGAGAEFLPRSARTA